MNEKARCLSEEGVPGRGNKYKGPDAEIWLVCSWINRYQFDWNGEGRGRILGVSTGPG